MIHTFDLAASTTAFLRLIVAHLECPAIKINALYLLFLGALRYKNADKCRNTNVSGSANQERNLTYFRIHK